MTKCKRITMTCAAIAAVAAGAAAPADASETISTPTFPPCIESPTLPSCVDYTFDVAQNSIAYTRYTYNEGIQPILNGAACEAYYRLTGQQCTRELVTKL